MIQATRINTSLCWCCTNQRTRPRWRSNVACSRLPQPPTLSWGYKQLDQSAGSRIDARPSCQSSGKQERALSKCSFSVEAQRGGNTESRGTQRSESRERQTEAATETQRAGRPRRAGCEVYLAARFRIRLQLHTARSQSWPTPSSVGSLQPAGVVGCASLAAGQARAVSECPHFAGPCKEPEVNDESSQSDRAKRGEGRD